jgi:hypothetical protein
MMDWKMPRELMVKRGDYVEERKLVKDRDTMIKEIAEKRHVSDLYIGLYHVSQIVYKNHDNVFDCHYLRRGIECNCLDHEQCHKGAIDRIRFDIDFDDTSEAVGLSASARFFEWASKNDYIAAGTLSGNGVHLYLGITGLESVLNGHHNERAKLGGVTAHLDDRLSLNSDDRQWDRVDPCTRLPGSINTNAIKKYKQARYVVPLSPGILRKGAEYCHEYSSTRPSKSWVIFGSKPMELDGLDSPILKEKADAYMKKYLHQIEMRTEQSGVYDGDSDLTIKEIVEYYRIPMWWLRHIGDKKNWVLVNKGDNNKRRYNLLCKLKTLGLRVGEVKRLLNPHAGGYLWKFIWKRFMDEGFEQSYMRAIPQDI